MSELIIPIHVQMNAIRQAEKIAAGQAEDGSRVEGALEYAVRAVESGQYSQDVQFTVTVSGRVYEVYLVSNDPAD